MRSESTGRMVCMAPKPCLPKVFLMSAMEIIFAASLQAVCKTVTVDMLASVAFTLFKVFYSDPAAYTSISRLVRVKTLAAPLTMTTKNAACFARSFAKVRSSRRGRTEKGCLRWDGLDEMRLCDGEERKK